MLTTGFKFYFGLGSALFKPGMTVADVAARAAKFVAAWRGLQVAP